MAIVVRFIDCGPGPKNRMDHACLQSSENVWRAITHAASIAHKFPQNVLWNALDRNLPEKSSAVKVAVQAQCLDLLTFPVRTQLDEWKRLSKIVAQGAFALFSAATAQWDAGDAYEPFQLVGNRSEVVVPEAARVQWQEALAAHKRMLALEDFGALSAAEMGGLFLLTHTPDNWVKVVQSFGLDYWWLRVLHLSVERNVDIKVCDFALVKPRAAEAHPTAMRMAQQQLSTIVALKVAIFYKLRHGERAQPVRVTRHDLEQTKRKWLKRPPTQRKRARVDGVADAVSTAMNVASLKALLPTREVLALVSEQRGTLVQRMTSLDRTVITGEAWRRLVEEKSAELQMRIMREIAALDRDGKDSAVVSQQYTAEVVLRDATEHARARIATTGLALDPADSIWRNGSEAVEKLVAVGACSSPSPQTLYVRTADEFRALFGTGAGGTCGSRAAARAATLEMESLAERLLALFAIDFRLRASTAERCPLPLELREELAVRDEPVASKVAAHVELYRRARKQELVVMRRGVVFAHAVVRTVSHAVHSAFRGCLRIVSASGTSAVVDACTTTRQLAALAVVNRMLTIAACFDGLLPAGTDASEEAIFLYDAATEGLELVDLEHVVPYRWPAARALADVAAACEAWLRNPRKAVEAPSPEEQFWVACTPRGLAISSERKCDALDALRCARGAWWADWPPTREQVTTHKTTATAIRWGGRATAAFLGIPKPCQFLGTPPFYGFET
jgi:hypothetical protein